MKKQIKLLIIITLLICFTNETYSQKGREKTIMYRNDYTANGHVAKNKFVENQNLTFRAVELERGIYSDSRVVRDTIISGKYFTKDGNAYIDGIWKKHDIRGQDYERNQITTRVKGVFKVSNYENGIGITTNKKKGKHLDIHLLSKNLYHINISCKNTYQGKLESSFSLESNIINIEEQKLYSDETFKKQILNEKKVKFSFDNGDVFIGSVEEERYQYGFYYSIKPHIGEYKYKNGEIIKGEISYSNYFGGRLKFFPEENSYTVFKDGTIVKGNWENKYVSSLNFDVRKSLYHKSESVTELINLAKDIHEKKNKEIEDKKREKEKEKIEKLKKKLKRQKELTSKYGENYGNSLSQGKLLPGMSEDMVKEVWEKEWFTINNIVRNGKMIEIWEFDKSKMQRDIMNKGKINRQEEGAIGLLLILNLSEELGLGGVKAPKVLVFTDKKLTDIYR